MTAENMRLSAEPQEPYGTAGIAQAFDSLGNPVCPDCGAGAITFAALANSGSSKRCLCEPPDPRIKAQPAFRVEAMVLLVRALDMLEATERTHPWDCLCATCQTAQMIRLGAA